MRSAILKARPRDKTVIVVVLGIGLGNTAGRRQVSTTVVVLVIRVVSKALFRPTTVVRLTLAVIIMVFEVLLILLTLVTTVCYIMEAPTMAGLAILSPIIGRRLTVFGGYLTSTAESLANCMTLTANLMLYG